MTTEQDRCPDCLGPPGHAHGPCGHCHGTGKCPHPFCVVCASPAYDDLPFRCGTCLKCAGEGINYTRTVPA